MTKTVSFSELITTRFAEILNSVDFQTVLALKGFTASEISSICSTAQELGCVVCVPDVAPLDINAVESGAREFLVSLMTPSDKLMACLYEQYLSVCDTLNGGVKLTGRRFVIVDNSMFLSVSPALIPEETVKELAAYFDSENTGDPEKLAIYTKYYSDADRFGTDGYGIRHLNRYTDEKLRVIPFFPAPKSEKFPENDCGNEIEALSDEMWQYVLDLQNGAIPEPVTIVCGENNNDECIAAYLAGVLTVLGVDFGIKKYNSFEEIVSSSRSFLPLLKRMHGGNAQFRMLKFYKSPNFSHETVEISQEAVISDIVNQSERRFPVTSPTRTCL